MLTGGDKSLKALVFVMAFEGVCVSRGAKSFDWSRIFKFKLEQLQLLGFQPIVVSDIQQAI